MKERSALSVAALCRSRASRSASSPRARSCTARPGNPWDLMRSPRDLGRAFRASQHHRQVAGPNAPTQANAQPGACTQPQAASACLPARAGPPPWPVRAGPPPWPVGAPPRGLESPAHSPQGPGTRAQGEGIKGRALSVQRAGARQTLGHAGRGQAHSRDANVQAVRWIWEAGGTACGMCSLTRVAGGGLSLPGCLPAGCLPAGAAAAPALPARPPAPAATFRRSNKLFSSHALHPSQGKHPTGLETLRPSNSAVATQYQTVYALLTCCRSRSHCSTTLSPPTSSFTPFFFLLSGCTAGARSRAGLNRMPNSQGHTSQGQQPRGADSSA